MRILGIRIRKEQAICVLLSLTAFAAVEWAGADQVLQDGAIARGAVGSEASQYEVLVNGLGEEELPVEITVSSKSLAAEEAEQVRREVMESLPERIKNGNLSLNEVRSDLDLINGIEELGVSLEWETGDPELIDLFGTVYNENLSEEGKQTTLKVEISDETGSSTFHLPVRILPPDWTEEEKRIREFAGLIQETDAKTRQEERLTLPAQFQGAELSYRMRPDRSSLLILFLGVLAAALYGIEEPIRRSEREKKRGELLLLDYSEVASKLQVYLGAGMTVRTAWERMGKDYERALAAGLKEPRPAYEEILQTCTDLSRGVSETEAYRRFGRRCGQRPYLKLSSLLEQNRKTGLKNLRQVLETEVADAFEERKNLAKRQGEEAGTKLLLPLFLMLGIVMVIVVVPAFLSFY